MYEKFEFPLEVQRWIVRKRLVSDKETISSTRVKNDEDLYLYLVPARSVGVTKESAQASYLGIPGQCLSILHFSLYRPVAKEGWSSRTTPPPPLKLNGHFSADCLSADILNIVLLWNKINKIE